MTDDDAPLLKHLAAQKPRFKSMSRPGINKAAMMAMTRVTITQGCTNQNLRVFTLVASAGSGRAIRPSICMKAGVDALSAGLTDGSGSFKTCPSEPVVGRKILNFRAHLEDAATVPSSTS